MIIPFFMLGLRVSPGIDVRAYIQIMKDKEFFDNFVSKNE